MNSLPGYTLDPMDSFAVPIIDTSSLEIYDKIVEDPHLILKIGWEWADGEFVVHRNPIEANDQWCVSHKESGAGVSRYTDDITMEGSIRKVQRILNCQSEKKMHASVKLFKKKCMDITLGETEDAREYMKKRGVNFDE